jgi:hypothetical protein
MDKIIEMLTSFNVPNLIATAAIFWYFTRDIKNEMKHLELRIEAQVSSQAARTDRLYEMFVALLQNKK